MTRPTFANAEQVSALADGQVRGPALEQTLTACAQDPQLLAAWRDYHLIGDALRGAAPLAQADEVRFLARLRPALAAQAPRRMAAGGSRRDQAANSPWFAQRWVAGVAVLAAGAGLAWSLVVGDRPPELALGESPVVASSPQGPVVRDAALEELLEAHRQQAGASVLPMPSGFLRNATFDAEPAALAERR